MACCERQSGMVPNGQDLIREKLGHIGRIFPGYSYSCVLNGVGEVIVHTGSSELDGDLPSAISSLQLAAEQFASHLSQADCSAIHISGANVMFSCYGVDANLLALYSDNTIDTFDMVAKDEQIEEEIIGDLRLMLQNLHVNGSRLSKS
uniref:Roadblock/LAMTOR2 domain-containing protein n=1 Tax=Pinguiococcus pyrenoidosus TaxID=172671 RepID=A0A7R9UAI9_9STRA|mmetsp:Transcript_3403/g.13540  ORF Transcript_3403/g.13540 Transcript_3403/m.13540 type:complete len:148 (+) Transcript_3403:146-589(+)